jgi:glycosyltransferase involved in cell wall biosynthesis
MYLSTKNALANSAYAIYVTEQFLQKRYPCRGNTISCSNVALPCFDDENLSKRIEKIKNTKFEKNIVLGTTGAVNVKYKGQQYVIEAISKLNKQGFSFEYQIVGGGDNRYLKSVAQKYGVQDKVKFLGSLPHEEVFKWLDTIDIYVQPSKTEGLPRALIESMSRACPAVVSSAGGNSELIDKEFIFTNGSVEGLCKILNKINSYNLLQQAKRNYQFSKKFQTEILDERRTDFLFKIRSVIKERDLDNVELANDSD